MAEKVTLVAIFYNEEEKLSGFFKNVKGVFDEIVVVDCSSTDRSARICRENGARVHISKVRFFENNISHALGMVADGNWAFILSADERLTPEIKKEIKEAIRSKEYDIFYAKRLQYYFDGFTRVGRVNDWFPRLFRKGSVWWANETPHEKPSTKGKSSKLKSVYYHYAYPTVRSFVRKMDQYLYTLPVEFEKIGKKKVSTAERDPRVAFVFGTHGWRMLFLYPIFSLFIMFFRYGLLFNGMRGIIYAMCVSVYAFLEEASYWEERSRKAKNIRFDWKKEYPDR